jgi:glycosyltransferase involved in cell wall biosynthesis
MTKVSIIAPVYNSAGFIEDSIQSVLNQTYPNIEYIIMDGGSTDGTLEIAQKYADKLTIVSEPDNGQSHAINKGWKRATGDVLAWLNADDLYVPDTVATAVNYLEQHPETRWVYGRADFTYEDGSPGNFRHPTFPWDYNKLLTFGCYIDQPTTFLQREIIDEFGYLSEALHFGMDYEYWLRIGKKFPAVYVPEINVKVKIFQDTKSRSGGYKRITEIEAMLKEYGATELPETMRHQWVEAMLDNGDLRGMWRYPGYVPRGTAKWLLRKLVPESRQKYLRQWLVRQD